MSQDHLFPYYENDWLDAIVGSGYFFPAIVAVVFLLLMLAVYQSRPESIPPRLFHRIKGRWTNGEYDFIIYFSPAMYEPRIRVIEKAAAREADEEWLSCNDYRLCFRGREAEFHNGQFPVTITPLSQGELRLMPGSDFTRMPELYPELSNDEGHVWNR